MPALGTVHEGRFAYQCSFSSLARGACPHSNPWTNSLKNSTRGLHPSSSIPRSGKRTLQPLRHPSEVVGAEFGSRCLHHRRTIFIDHLEDEQQEDGGEQSHPPVSRPYKQKQSPSDEQRRDDDCCHEAARSLGHRQILEGEQQLIGLERERHAYHDPEQTNPRQYFFCLVSTLR